ncbi:butyrophilin subfamily 1 member A1-like isoform X2 [Sparus aurata]|uniref:butyrophilin subfamily 1 member A1-like isoform X2 n=1 Tax=Sparus aurata TaxID=8175 RepID=UPI0011C17CBC|nr:butyrophilin subfamily 1 member A1-like isoform X2 [Sparus aurata]
MELLPLVCLCLLSCSGDARVTVLVKEDGDAVLPCLISNKEDITGKLFDWRKVESQKENKEVFMYDAGSHYNNGRPGQDDQFKGRVSHFQDQLQNGNASIKITRTKMDDSGNYSCDFPRHQPSQPFIVELLVDQVLRDRTGENIPGAAPEPNIKTLDHKPDWALLQCEAHGYPPLRVEWKDSAGKTLPAEEPQISKQGRYSYVTVNITVTKTDDYSCVATQKNISHQVAAVIPVHIQGAAPEPVSGWSGWWIVGGAVVIVGLVAVIILLIRCLCRGSTSDTTHGPRETELRDNMI